MQSSIISHNLKIVQSKNQNQKSFKDQKSLNDKHEAFYCFPHRCLSLRVERGKKLTAINALILPSYVLTLSQQGRELWWKYKKNYKKKKKKLVGDCSALSGKTDFVAQTSYTLNENILVTYPCSGGYLRNFAANENLLEDVREAINAAGHDLGIDADCANLCDVDNASYGTASSTGYGSVERLL
jgi:hypothetical protein